MFLNYLPQKAYFRKKNITMPTESTIIPWTILDFTFGINMSKRTFTITTSHCKSKARIGHKKIIILFRHFSLNNFSYFEKTYLLLVDFYQKENILAKNIRDKRTKPYCILRKRNIPAFYLNRIRAKIRIDHLFYITHATSVYILQPKRTSLLNKQVK